MSDDLLAELEETPLRFVEVELSGDREVLDSEDAQDLLDEVLDSLSMIREAVRPALAEAAEAFRSSVGVALKLVESALREERSRHPSNRRHT